MGVPVLMLFLFSTIPITSLSAQIHHQVDETEQLVSTQTKQFESKVIEVKGDPESVIWVVQLSDLHFSVHHPDRALDFKKIVGPALQMINPSLVLITGDLTDGKSKDLLTMKQNEDEWLEYQNVMEDVVKRRGLDKNIFYDLRGNHDNFGVPAVGGSFDFFLNYSISGQLGRRRNVNSITVETGDRKHLFVGLDTTMSVGLRGPTNLFGHPTDQLLTQLESQLSQWDSQSNKSVTKIAFGHFPVSFSAFSHSGKSLKDTFLNNSLSAYLCGHLHSRFGKNLKRHHQSIKSFLSSQKFLQLNIHQVPSQSTKNCSFGVSPPQEFWEWEMGDWRKSRAMRIMAIDRGHVSYLDIDFKSGARKTIVLPTFPLDSRTMSTSSWHQKYECQHMIPSSFETVRALVFSVSPIVSVMARIYDANPGTLSMVMETPMTKVVGEMSRGDFYAAPWNYKAFEDPFPDRFWLQIEVIDVMGRSTLTELRPFSVNGLNAKISWTWKEFFVMGCQWAAFYYPLFWSSVYFMLSLLLIPKVLLIFLRKQYSYKSFIVEKSILNGIVWVLQDLSRLSIAWFGFLVYLFYLFLCPWCIGHVFTDGRDLGYMTYMGWVVRSFSNSKRHEYIGFPDIMVVVLPHLLFVVFPSILVAGALAAERGMFKERFLSCSGKKEDDGYSQNNQKSQNCEMRGNRRPKFYFGERWIRKMLLVVCLAICWKHFMNCRALVKAYEMNPLLHFPVYAFAIPLLLAYTVYKTRRI
ncbi:putative metallophosphoesterase At3g03305 [Ricinus communis]|uniref:putative metallophosphoesterase At3g03305 n=1 Tax=Ricinus communis TaxID=3988 RepID=UPI000772A1DE|nr:putative metallophosphoesterase At3g03305 [Ricinus communis]|eukprot:XP_015572259.1 putative metallophosphoesterase At3g03305 [Ricinus communis]